MCVCAFTCVCVCVRTCVSTCARAYVCTGVCVCVSVCMRVYVCAQKRINEFATIIQTLIMQMLEVGKSERRAHRFCCLEIITQ